MENKIYNQGFTLVEALVAVSIFTLSILGLISIVSSGITNTRYAQEKLIAGYLAQEGVEYIRNMRDTYVLYDSTSPQNGWNQFWGKLTIGSCHLENGCYFDPGALNYNDPNLPITAVNIFACGASCLELSYNELTGKYEYGGSLDSGFTRKINVREVSPGNEIEVSSTVYWKQGSGTYSTTFSTNLYNWIE